MGRTFEDGLADTDRIDDGLHRAFKAGRAQGEEKFRHAIGSKFVCHHVFQDIDAVLRQHRQVPVKRARLILERDDFDRPCV